MPPAASNRSSAAAVTGTKIEVPLCSVFRRYLKSIDLKYTTERADVLDAIVAMDRPFEAEELLQTLTQRKHRVSKATVYRTLRLLVDAGILAQVLLDRERTHYQVIHGKPPSDLLICVRSGRRLEIVNPKCVALAQEICRELGWEHAGQRLQVYGISPEARASAQK